MSWDKTKDEMRDQVIRQTNKKKKTNRWCKGKPGVPHLTEIVVNHNATRLQCKWYAIYFSYMRRDEGPKDYRYSCKHAIKCKNCGKYTNTWLTAEQCPDGTPKPGTDGPA